MKRLARCCQLVYNLLGGAYANKQEEYIILCTHASICSISSFCRLHFSSDKKSTEKTKTRYLLFDWVYVWTHGKQI